MSRTIDRDVRQPDFADPIARTLVWIGDDGAVEIPWEQGKRVERTFMNAGGSARVGMSPSSFGITVERFTADFIHPGTGVSEIKGESDFTHTLWRVLVDALSANDHPVEWELTDDDLV